jgi:hypothetical protein
MHRVARRIYLRGNSWVALPILLIGMNFGCGPERQAQRSLESVARDWCMTIRASQVIPVYPLTEDLEVGDVFLVTLPYESQAQRYTDRGYLPLEVQMARLGPLGHEVFYRDGYAVTEMAWPPRVWQFPAAGGSDFALAPRASFPTYSFSVSSSAGLDLAVPVQGVPIGLNLLNAASAHGALSIKDAFTYGTDVAGLLPRLESWARQHRPVLKQFAPVRAADGTFAQQYFLRAVTRVYLTRRITVSLTADQVFSSEAAAGVASPVTLLNLARDGQAAKRNFDLINQLIDEVPTTQPNARKEPADDPQVAGEPATMPAQASSDTATVAAPGVGGRVRLIMASGRQVTLDETFLRPLVVGYLAFDVPIHENGELGAPVATWAQLESQQARQADQAVRQARFELLGDVLEAKPDEFSTAIERWLQADNNLDESERRRQLLWRQLELRQIDRRQTPEVISAAVFADLRRTLVRALKISVAQ